jgi:hypothetical protein
LRIDQIGDLPNQTLLTRLAESPLSMPEDTHVHQIEPILTARNLETRIEAARNLRLSCELDYSQHRTVVLFSSLHSESPENGNIRCFSQRLLGILGTKVRQLVSGNF